MYLANDCITIYNRRLTEQKTKEYIPTVIRGVHWFGTEQTAVVHDGLIGAKQFTIRVPVDASFSDKSFISPIQYHKVPDVSTYFTFDSGDIIVRGEAVEFGENTRPGKLQELYDDVVTVIAVTDNRCAPRGKHWRIVCK